MNPQARSEAAAILKTARVSISRLNYTGFVTWRDRAQQVRAFDLFNEHSGHGPIYTHSIHDHSRVFNWLLDVVMEGVEAGQMEIEQA